MAVQIVNKSVFSIHPFNKKNVTVGYLIDKQISIVILLECVLTRRTLQLDLAKWRYLVDERKFYIMLDKLYTHSKRVIICENFFYSINLKNETLSFQAGMDRITLSRYNLLRLKEIQCCIDAYILEKQNKLHLYQPCFDLMYLLLKQEIQDLPIACHKEAFISTYIQSYGFNLNEISCENKCFILEVQQFNHEKLSNMLLQELNI